MTNVVIHELIGDRLMYVCILIIHIICINTYIMNKHMHIDVRIKYMYNIHKIHVDEIIADSTCIV